ncbi:MAG: ABC transporter permease [Candidatus Atribacteria bacterium]|nr:ABC transporter permease [Candidatus Atribacteria bacterium]
MNSGKALSILKRFAGFQAFTTFLSFFILASIFVPRFLQTMNLINIFRQGALIFSFSVAMTLCMLIGGLDLSVGAVASLSAVYAATFIRSGNIFTGILVGLIIGMVCGIFNGIIISKFKLPHFIMTYGMLKVAQGLALNYTKGEFISGFSDSFRWLGISKIGFIPIPVIISMILLIIFLFITYRTVLGRSIYAVGANNKAALFSGIPVDRTIIYIYGLSGLLSAFAGIIFIARLGSATGIMGETWPLQAIAAVVLGGTSFSGGEGSIGGTAFGAMSIAIIYNILNLLGISTSWQNFVVGFVIVIMVTFNIIGEKIVGRRKLLVGKEDKLSKVEV